MDGGKPLKHALPVLVGREDWVTRLGKFVDVNCPHCPQYLQASDSLGLVPHSMHHYINVHPRTIGTVFCGNRPSPKRCTICSNTQQKKFTKFLERCTHICVNKGYPKILWGNFPQNNALPDDIQQLSLLPHSGDGSKHTSTTRHTLLSLHQYTLLSSMLCDPCSVPRHEYWIMFLSLAP